MPIYLVRHGHAVAAHEGLPDPQRHLSAHGRQVCRGVGRLLRQTGVSFDVVLTSPLVRAVQTAELVAEAVGYLGVIEARAAFMPGADPAAAAAEILAHAGSVAVFSHEPTVSTLVGFLAGQPGFAPFLPAQVCCLEERQPVCRLVWKIHPEAMQLQEQRTA